MCMLEDTRTVKEIEREMCAGYELEYYDRDSIREIEHSINLNAYKDAVEVKEHMDFLERLLFKLQSIRIEEMKEGFPTLELDESITEINHLFRKLANIFCLLNVV